MNKELLLALAENERLTDLLNQSRKQNSTIIELCAQVAEEYIGIGTEDDDRIRSAIAAAIRALKDSDAA